MVREFDDGLLVVDRDVDGVVFPFPAADRPVNIENLFVDDEPVKVEQIRCRDFVLIEQVVQKIDCAGVSLDVPVVLEGFSADRQALAQDKRRFTQCQRIALKGG